MYDDHLVKKVLASITIFLLILFLAYAMVPFLGAIFGAVIMYVIFSPIYKKLNSDIHLSRQISAGLTMLLSLILIIIPFLLVAGMVYSEIGSARSNIDIAVSQINNITNLAPSVDLDNLLNQEIGNIGGSMGKVLLNTAGNVWEMAINFIILYIFFYYLLVSSEESRKRAISLVPFNRKNTKKLITEFKNVTHTAIVVSGIIAVSQGALITLAFLAFKIPGAFFWGFMAAIFSFLPFVGPHLIWIPIFVIKLIQHDYTAAAIFLILGIFISSLDSFIRPALQKQMGNIHPLVSLVGVFAAVPIFGLLGIIIGPLLLSYLLLMMRMYREEYLDND